VNTEEHRMPDHVVISADSHVQEPTDLWTSRLPADLRDRAPKYERLPETHQKRWWVGGRVLSLTPEYERVLPGGGVEDIGADDIAGYLSDLDHDGVWAATLHPNTGLFVFDLDDAELAYACARVYNDHMADIYQSERLFPNAIIPLLDTERALAEIEHAVSIGLHGLEMPQSAPAGRPYFADHHEKVWAAAEANGLPIAMHIGTGMAASATAEDGASIITTGPSINPGRYGREEPSYVRGLTAKRLLEGGESGFGAFGGACTETIPALVGSGVLDRHPDLHFVFVETNGRWLATVLDNMDEAFHIAPGAREVQRIFFTADGKPFLHHLEGEIGLDWEYDLKPSDYARRQMHVTFMDDWVALRNRDLTGVDCLCWGSDYPHFESTYPRSTEAIDTQIARAALTQEESAKIFGGTIAGLYGIQLPVPA
jgi:predicted TIM-barrel fold metal-dependent hydrolase